MYIFGGAAQNKSGKTAVYNDHCAIRQLYVLIPTYLFNIFIYNNGATPQPTSKPAVIFSSSKEHYLT